MSQLSPLDSHLRDLFYIRKGLYRDLSMLCRSLLGDSACKRYLNSYKEQ
jgi:hypothetical protein